MANAATGWIILRTSGRHTMRLAETLREDGYDAWTPIEHRTIRKPRSNVRRKIMLPIMPSYVFARAPHLIDLIQLSGMQVKPRAAKRKEGEDRPAPHASFSVMHYHDHIPIIVDAHLQRLRELEAKLTPKPKAERALDAGVEVKVKIEGGSFAGMKGVVRKSDEGYTLVCFDSRLSVKIPTFLLDQDSVGADQPTVSLMAA